MMAELINPDPIVHARKATSGRRQVVGRGNTIIAAEQHTHAHVQVICDDADDSNERQPIDVLEVFEVRTPLWWACFF